MSRAALLAEIFERARGRRVFGYNSDDGHGAELTKDGRLLLFKASVHEQRKAAAGIDRVCIEGEKAGRWQEIPKGKP